MKEPELKKKLAVLSLAASLTVLGVACTDEGEVDAEVPEVPEVPEAPEIPEVEGEGGVEGEGEAEGGD